MMRLRTLITIFSFLFGLVVTKPVDKNSNKNLHENISFDQAFRQAEMTLNRYFYEMNSDTDHLVHAVLYILLNNPTLFPYVPNRAMDIAFKNVANKLGQADLDILTKPMLLTIERNFQSNLKDSEMFQLTDEMKDEIEDALDEFLEKTAHSSTIQE